MREMSLVSAVNNSLLTAPHPYMMSAISHMSNEVTCDIRKMLGILHNQQNKRVTKNVNCGHSNSHSHLHNAG